MKGFNMNVSISSRLTNTISRVEPPQIVTHDGKTQEEQMKFLHMLQNAKNGQYVLHLYKKNLYDVCSVNTGTWHDSHSRFLSTIQSRTSLRKRNAMTGGTWV